MKKFLISAVIFCVLSSCRDELIAVYEDRVPEIENIDPIVPTDSISISMSDWDNYEEKHPITFTVNAGDFNEIEIGF